VIPIVLNPSLLTSAAPKLLGELVSVATKEVSKEVIRQAFGSHLSGHTDLFLEQNDPLARAAASLALDKEAADRLGIFLTSDAFVIPLRSLLAGVVKGVDLREQVVAVLLPSIAAEISGAPAPAVESFTRELVNLTVRQLAGAWESACKTNMLSPDQLAVGISHACVVDEVARINTYLSRQIRASREAIQKFGEFARAYTEATGRQHSKLRPPALGDVVEIDIDKLYVPSDVSPVGHQKTEKISRRRLLETGYRIVLLGQPGGGKSTFASKLCHELSVDSRINYGGRRPMPVVVVLRDYEKYRASENGGSIVEFIASRCEIDFQIPPVAGAFEYLFLTSQAVVIFDGLDELTETSKRMEVKHAVEHFAARYPSLPILVTSREVGYEQAPLSRDIFEVYKLAPFDNEQVREYAHKWFALSGQGSAQEKSALANAFLTDSTVIRDIRTNPLMLALLCNLYKQDGYLPSNRPEIYQRCADLLFVKWDKGRGINMSIPHEYKLRAAMGFLAHWIYTDNSLKRGVTEAQLIEAVGLYLSEWIEDPEERHSIASQFISYFRGRAWVFSDVGSTASEPIYQFTHGTFLEFFTAEFIAKTYSQTDALEGYLLPRIKAREWDVVCQLAYQMVASRTIGGNQLAEGLLRASAGCNDDNRSNVLSFAARSLDWLETRPGTRREICRACADAVLVALEHEEREDMVQADEIVSAIGLSRGESRALNVEAFCERLMARFAGNDLTDKVLAGALIVADDLNYTFFSKRYSYTSTRFSEKDEKAAAQMRSRLTPWIEVTSPKSLDLSLACWRTRRHTLTRVVAEHGLDALAVIMSSPFSGYWAPIIFELAQFSFGDTARSPYFDSEWFEPEVNEAVKLLAKEPLPWVNAQPEFLHLVPRSTVTEWPTNKIHLLGILYASMLFGDGFDGPHSPNNRSQIVSDLRVFRLSHTIAEAREAASGIVNRLLPDCPEAIPIHKWIAGESAWRVDKQSGLHEMSDDESGEDGPEV
jgi:hypothetical protein